MFLAFTFVLIGGVSGSFFGGAHIVTGCIIGLIISVLEKGSTSNVDSQFNSGVGYSDGYIPSGGLGEALAISEITDQEGFVVNETDSFHSIVDDTIVNPATGLLMADGIGGVDVGGSPFGIDSHELDTGFESIDCGTLGGVGDDFSMDNNNF